MPATHHSPLIYARPEHGISRANISQSALRVLYGLKAAGYQAYLVGGGVRDLLLGREPKDFDVATDAHPEQVRAVFNRCRLIGRRFRLAHVYMGRDIIEVATFRGGVQGEQAQATEEGMILRDNSYGTLEEDALRRDFTVNALYYNIDGFSLVDYSGGFEDLTHGTLRLIGDPQQRYSEDPVRMLRAVRFASKLGFAIEQASEEPIARMGGLLANVPPARLFEEVLKLFMHGVALETFEKLRHYDLFRVLFPSTEEALGRLDHEFPITLVSRGLANTDQRVVEGKPVTPAFLFALLLWEPVRLAAQELSAAGETQALAIQQAAARVLGRQRESVMIPKRFTLQMQDIWHMQHRFENRSGKRPQRLLASRGFRAAYDFLLLRGEAGEADKALVAWWTDFVDEGVAEPVAASKKPRRRRRRKSANGAGATEAGG